MSKPPEDLASAFTNHLRQLALREDRAALAALRRGLGKPPGQAPEMFPHLVPWIPRNASTEEESALYLVASLVALHPQPLGQHGQGQPTNMGFSYAQLRNRTGSGSEEARFVAMLNAEREDLDHHLLRAVSLLRAHQVGWDWAQLIRDLRWWSHPNRRVRRAWAGAYWAREADVMKPAVKPDEKEIHQ